MLLPSELFITDYTSFFADLFRNGNSLHPRFDHLRPGHDAHIYEVDGQKWIRADGNGISAFTTFDATRKNWWKIPKGLSIPEKLRLVKDIRAGMEHHCMIASAKDMLLSEYVELMEQIRVHCKRVS